MRKALGIDTGQAIEKSPYVMAPAQFSVGHDRETGVFLLEDRETHGVVLRFLQIGAGDAPRRSRRWTIRAWVLALSGNSD
jgi:hypothetical protein